MIPFITIEERGKVAEYDVKKHRKLKENVRCHGAQEPEAGGQRVQGLHSKNLRTKRGKDRTRPGGMSQRGKQLWRWKPTESKLRLVAHEPSTQNANASGSL